MPHILILELFKKFQNGKLSPILDSIFIRWDTSHNLFSDNMIFLQINFNRLPIIFIFGKSLARF